MIIYMIHIILCYRFLLTPQTPSRLVVLIIQNHLLIHSLIHSFALSRAVQEELALVEKNLLYAPPTDQGASIMEALLQELGPGMSQQWTLRPMMAADNLLASHLGSQLTQALIETRRYQCQSSDPSEQQQQQQQQQQESPVVFLGMDSPELPLDEIVAALWSTEENGMNNNTQHHAHLCPAADGGYGMLSVPAHAPAEAVFRGVKWSHPLTAVSQIKALTDIEGVCVRLGRCMHDIDETSDVKALCERLRVRPGEQEGIAVEAAPTDTLATPNDANAGDIADCLQVQSASAAAVTGGRPQTGSCQFTRKALIELGQL
jgi:glycosyltransferase A (GT-A) superfamily protein (DUF2064 family)